MFSLVAEACQKEGCPNLALGEDSLCPECDHAMCREHYDDLSHTCGYILKMRSGRNELVASLADLDQRAIEKRVTELRPNVPFQLLVPQNPDDTEELAGSFNFHVEIVFEDGVQWLARISRSQKGDGPIDLLRDTTESEVLTYRLLHNHGIAVPVVYDWGAGDFSKTRNPLGRYIIYDKMPGLAATDAEVGLSDDTMEKEDMRIFATDFASISVQLSNIHCEAIGSLVNSQNGEIKWGPHRNVGYPENQDAPYFGGPFYTLCDRYVYRIDALINLIKKGLIYRKSPLLHYLAFMEARRLVMGDPVLSRRESSFYIRHPDCSGANILANEVNIVGLIDWEWTASTTKAAAFAAPKWAYETDDYLNGDNSQTPEEDLLSEAYKRVGRSDLAECIRGGRRYHRLADILLHWDPCLGEKRALGQLTGLTRAFEGEDKVLPVTLGDWVEWAKEMHKEKPDLEVIVGLDEQFRKLRHRRPENAASEGTVPNLLKLMGYD